MAQFEYAIKLNIEPNLVRSSTLLHITSHYSGCGYLDASSIQKKFDFLIEANQPFEIMLDSVFSIPADVGQQDSITRDGIYLISNVPVELYYTYLIGTPDTFTMRGIDHISSGFWPGDIFQGATPYLVNDLQQDGGYFDAQWSIIPYKDSTIVSLYQENNYHDLFPVNRWGDTLVNRGQAIHAGDGRPDARVEFLSDKPTAFYHQDLGLTGVTFEEIGRCLPNCRSITNESAGLQQMPESWYSNYYHLAPWHQSQGELYYILSFDDNNQLLLDGSPLAQLNRGDMLDTVLHGPHVISGSGDFNVVNQPLNLFPVTNDSIMPTTLGFMVMAEDTSHLVYESLFPTVLGAGLTDEYFVQVIMHTDDTASLRLDGSPVGNAGFAPFAHDSNWAWANFSVPPGLRRLSSPAGFLGACYARPTPEKIDVSSSANWQGRPDSSEYYGFRLVGQAQVRPSFEEFSLVSDTGLAPVPQNITACDSVAVALLPPGYRYTSWQWDFGDGSGLLQETENEEPDTIYHTWPQPGTYTVSATSPEGCAPGISFTVEVQPGPEADFSYEVKASCEGSAVMFTNTSGSSNINWQVNGQDQENRQSWLYEAPEGADSLLVRLSVREGKCSSEKMKVIPIVRGKNEVKVPNIFTPNGDGRNDCFKVKGAENFAECYSLQVFNRFGTKVFETQNPSACWKGTAGDKQVVPGVYFYLLKIGEEDYQGHLTLMGK